MTAKSAFRTPASPIPLLLILAVGLLLRLFYFVGVGGYDDISYFNHALECLNGTFSTAFEPGGEFPFRYRVGIVLPTAAMFKFFGPSEYTAAVLPMLVSLGLIWLSWRLGRMISKTTGLIAAVLMATFPMAVVSAGSMLVGPFSAFFCGLSIMLWLEAEGLDRLHDGTTSSTHAVPYRNLRYLGCGLSLGIAYLFRIEAGLHAIVFAALALTYRRPRIGWFIAGTAALAVVAAENTVYWAQHGEWLYRLRVVSGSFAEIQSDLSGTVLEHKSAWMYVKAMFLKPVDMGLHGAAFTAVAFSGLFSFRSNGRTPFLLWFWLILLYLSFGTWSMTAYVPTTKNPRYLMNIVLPGIVLLAGAISELTARRGAMRVVAMCGTTGLVAGSLVLLNVLYVYRVENASGSRLAANRLELLSPERNDADLPVWCEHYTSANLRCFLPAHDVRALSSHELSLGIDEVCVEADQIDRGYVVVDQFLMQKYVAYSDMHPPVYLLNPPSHWHVVADDPHPASGFAYAVVRWLSELSGDRLTGLHESLRSDRIIIYEVEQRRKCHPSIGSMASGN